MSPHAGGRPPKAIDHPLFAWLTSRPQPFGLVELGAEVGCSYQSISHYTTGRRAIARALADRWERESHGKVPWHSWPLVRGKAGWFHLGVLVGPADLPALRLRLNPPSLARLLDPVEP